MASEDDFTREPLKVLVFSASMREQSLNTRLARLAAAALEATGVEVDFATMEQFDCPSYDGDIEDTQGIPEGAAELHRRINGTDGFVIVSPEYNASMPGALKNAIDWTSRHRPQPFHEHHCLLLSASPSMSGGNRGLWALRMPLEHLGTRVYPDMFSLAQAHSAIDADGKLTVPVLQERLEQTVAAWADLVEASKHYPCAKARWVEFLGEEPVPVIDRVE
ncbi:MAG: NADPH-dependent reductase [Thermoleophilia bacterium]|nr:NADPH-dependent reductase [Thermoleophilia bacterium]